MATCKRKKKKEYPCLRCGEHVKINAHAVQCAMRELWVHKKCETMDDATFAVLDMQHEETGQCFWSCKSCKNYALKFDRRMRAIKKRVTDRDTMKNDVASVKKDIETLSATTVKLTTDAAEKKGEDQSELTTAVFDEMRERESQHCNIIIHNLAEPPNEVSDKKERILHDKNRVQGLCDVIGAEVNVIESARFARRLGPVADNDIPSPHPLLIGFKTEDGRDAVLEKSPLLGDKDEPWSSVNVVMDLTKCQRKEEKKLRDTASKKNTELGGDEAGNWRWKVIGFEEGREKW